MSTFYNINNKIKITLHAERQRDHNRQVKFREEQYVDNDNKQTFQCIKICTAVSSFSM